MSIAKRIAWFAGLFFFLILIVLPLLISTLIQWGRLPAGVLNYLGIVETLQTWSMQAFTAAWLFFLGGCFASFINVVAWRVPRGRSILGSSHCPTCNVRLPFRDNLPVIGWLNLGGKCRSCGTKISARYLIAELVLGCVFLFYATVVLTSGGWNLPLRSVNQSLSFESLLLNPPWDLIRILVYHLVLLSTLFMFALIAADRFRLSISVVWFSVLVGLLLPYCWPEVALIHWNGHSVGDLLIQDGWGKLLTPFFGLSVGYLAGYVTLMGIADTVFRENFATGLATVGLFLGWQAAISTILMSLAIAGIGSYFALKKRAGLGSVTHAENAPHQFWNWNSALLVASIVQLLTWRLQVDWIF